MCCKVLALRTLLLLITCTWPLVVNAFELEELPEQLTVRFETSNFESNVEYLASALESLTEEEVVKWTIHYSTDQSSAPSEIINKGILGNVSLAGRLPMDPIWKSICLRNSHVCRVEIIPERAKIEFIWNNEIAPPALIHSQPKWRPCNVRKKALQPFELCLPNVEIQPYETSKIVAVNPSRGISLNELATNKSQGCTSWGDACIQKIERLNWVRLVEGSPLEASYVGSLRIPIVAVGLTLPITSSRQYDSLVRTVERSISRAKVLAEERNEVSSIFLSSSIASTIVNAVEVPASSSNMANIMAPMKAMNHPYPSEDQMKKGMEDPDLKVKVTVGIWDKHLDTQHCDINPPTDMTVVLETMDDVDNAKNNTERLAMSRFPLARSCNHYRESPSPTEPPPFVPRWDHASHMAGLIVGRLNSTGVVGVNPSAKLWAYDIDKFQGKGKKQEDPFAEALNGSSGHLRVINMSLSFSEYAGSIQNSITSRVMGGEDESAQGYHKDLLFVVAAGNAQAGRVGSRITDVASCNVQPACWSTRLNGENGVISVVGLAGNDTHKLLSETNRGPVFDVAAVGEAISTIDGNYLGMSKGSSVAASYVSGLASLIYSKRYSALPKQVKERILYTADFSRELDDAVGYGMINFNRALDIAHDILRLDDNACSSNCPRGGNVLYYQKNGCQGNDCVVSGNLQKNPDDFLEVVEGFSMKLGRRDTITQLRIPMSHIRRIAPYTEGTTRKYWIIYHDGDGKLVKLYAAQFKPESTLRYRDGNDDAIRTVSIGQITEYTSRL